MGEGDEMGEAAEAREKHDVEGSLPGGDLIAEGRRDLAQRRETAAALLVSIGAPKLARLGEPVGAPLADPEGRLYQLLAREDPDSAHSRYNALVRRLVSYERARACAR